MGRVKTLDRLAELNVGDAPSAVCYTPVWILWLVIYLTF